MLEKTPKNALRVRSSPQAWPERIFVYLYRKPRPTMASMIEAWVVGPLPHLSDAARLVGLSLVIHSGARAGAT